MNHQSVTGIVLDAATGQNLPALRNVVLLVEDRCAGVGRVGEHREACDRRDSGDESGDDPAAQSVGRAEIRIRYQRAGTTHYPIARGGRWPLVRLHSHLAIVGCQV